MKFKNAQNRSATAIITVFSKGTCTQNGICFGETCVMYMGLFGEADINISTIPIYEWDNVISKKDRTKGIKFGMKVRSVRGERYVSICAKDFRTLRDWKSL